MKAEYSAYYTQLGFRIKQCRTEACLTQEQLAERIGKSAAYIGHLEAPGGVQNALAGYLAGYIQGAAGSAAPSCMCGRISADAETSGAPSHGTAPFLYPFGNF